MEKDAAGCHAFNRNFIVGGYLSEILEYSPERKGMESSTVDYDPQFVNLKDFASTNP